jgi:flagellar basal-body rod protein FlgC
MISLFCFIITNDAVALMDPLLQSVAVAGAGARVQGERLKVIAENIANKNSTGTNPNEDPYRRKIISFRNKFDRKIGTEKIVVYKKDYDQSEFPKKYDPAHPAADADGYVSLPNVSEIIENMDSREAQKSHEANLSVIDNSKSMLTRTIEMLR